MVPSSISNTSWKEKKIKTQWYKKTGGRNCEAVYNLLWKVLKRDHFL